MLKRLLSFSSSIITAIFLICILLLNTSVSASEFPTEIKISQYRNNIFISWLNDHGDNNFVSPFDKNSTFEISYRISGTQEWETLTSTQQTWVKITTLQENTGYDFKVTEINTNGDIVSVSDIKNFSPTINKSSAGINLDIDINSLSADEFPFIYLTAMVDSAGYGLFDLDENNFTVYENGILQDSLYQVFPPSDTTLVATDIVFVFDITGSMGNEIISLQTHIQLFADSLEAVGTDFRIGLVTFDDYVNMYNSGNLLPAESLYVFRNWVNNLNAWGGDDGPENAFGALEAATTMNFRPGAQKVFILITDAPAHYDQDYLCSNCSYSGQFTTLVQQTIVDLLNANGVTCYTVGPDLGTERIYEPYCIMGDCFDYQYYGAPNSLTNATGGEWYWILDDFRGIIDDLVGNLASQYVIRYHTKNPECDGIEREVVLIVNDFGETDQDTAYYIPCSAPDVIITDYTRDLENIPQPPNQDIIIDAWVIDNIEPYPVSATLYYRFIGDPVYNSVPMTNISDSLWRGVIPSIIVDYPGLDYYVTATDGITTGSAPSADPSLLPYQIAVIPNEAPVITHTPISTPHPINIPTYVTADVFDTTDYVDFVELYYRRFGDLIYTKSVMAESSLTTYYATIPAYYNYEFGFEYFIRAVDNFGIASYHGDADLPHQVNVGTVENSPPVINISNNLIIFCEDDTVNFSFTVTDADGTTPEIKVVGLIPDGAWVDTLGYTIGWAPLHTAGTFPMYITACDSFVCVYDTIIIEVIECNDNDVTPTYEWINVYCYNPTLNDEPIVPGDVIRAYDPDGVLCGKYIMTDSTFGFMPIYRDDEFTTEIDEGAEPGDLISFTINDQEIFTDPEIYWTANGASFELCTFYSCQKLNLQEGWNLVSWNFNYTADIETLLQLQDDSGHTLGDYVSLMLGFDRGALTYNPLLPQYSTLNEVDYYHGYWFLMSSPFELDICGEKIDIEDYIPIYEGWNLVSYWPQESHPVEDALSSIYPQVEVVLGWDNDYQIHIPGEISNNLIEMDPGHGYWIKSNSDASLMYPGWYYAGVSTKHQQTSNATENKLQPTSNWVSLYGSDIIIDNLKIADNSTIEAVSTNGTICGSGVYKNGILRFVPVYGFAKDNQTTAGYPKPGDKVEIHINGKRVYPDITWTENGAVIQLARLYSSENLLPKEFNLSQNYPNPFNPTTKISFTIPRTSQVELTIFNILGQRVITLINEQLSEGTYNVSWDGTIADGNSVSSGMYLYRLTSGGQTLSKKMILTK